MTPSTAERSARHQAAMLKAYIVHIAAYLTVCGGLTLHHGALPWGVIGGWGVALAIHTIAVVLGFVFDAGWEDRYVARRTGVTGEGR